MRKIWNYRQLQNQQPFELLNSRQMPASYGEFMPMQQANGKTAAGIYHNGTWYNSEPFAYPSYGYQPIQPQAIQVVQPQQQTEPYNNQAYCYQPVQAHVGQLSQVPQVYHQPKPLTYDTTAAYNCQPVQLVQPNVVAQQPQQFATANPQPYFYQPYGQQPVQLTAIQPAANTETFNMQTYNNQSYHLQPVQLCPGQGAPSQSETENINYQSYDGQPFNYQPVQLNRKLEDSNTEGLNLPPYGSQSYDFQPMQPEELDDASQQPNAQHINLQPYQQATCDYPDPGGELQQPLEPNDNLKEQLEQTGNYVPPYDCQVCKEIAAQKSVQMPPFGSKEASEFSTIQIDLSAEADVIITRTQLKLVVAISKRPGCVQGKTELTQGNPLNETTIPMDPYKPDVCSYQNQPMGDIPVVVQPQTEVPLTNPQVETTEPIGEPTEPGKLLNGMNKVPVLQQSSLESFNVIECPETTSSTNTRNEQTALLHNTEDKSLTQTIQNIDTSRVECLNNATNMLGIVQPYRAPRRTVQRNVNEANAEQPNQTKSLNFDQSVNEMDGQNAAQNLPIISEDTSPSKPSQLVSKILSVNSIKKTESVVQSSQKSIPPEKFDKIYPPTNSKIIILKNFELTAQEVKKAATKVIFQTKSSVVTSQITTTTPAILKINPELVHPDKTVTVLRASSEKFELPATTLNLNSLHSTQYSTTSISSVQVGMQPTLQSIISNSNAVKIPQVFKSSHESTTTTKIISQKHTEHVQPQMVTPATKNFSLLKRSDKVKPDKKHLQLEKPTESIKSYTVYSKSKLNTESFKFTTLKDKKSVEPPKPEAPLFVIPRQQPDKLASDKNKNFVEEKQEIPLAAVLHKNPSGKNTLEKTNEKVAQRQESSVSAVTSKGPSETVAAEISKLPLPQKGDFPPTENPQGKSTTEKTKIIEPKKQAMSVSVTTPMEPPGKLATAKIKIVATQKRESPAATATLNKNKKDVVQCPEVIETTTPKPVSKQKLQGARSQKNGAVSIPKPKETKIDTLILNAFSDKTETAPFGSRQQNQPKKQQNKLSKLERKVLRRQAKEEQEQLLAEKKAQDDINTKNNNKSNTNNNKQNGEVDTSETIDNNEVKTENPAVDVQSEDAYAEIDSSTEAQFLEMKGLADPQIRRSLARIIQKIKIL